MTIKRSTFAQVAAVLLTNTRRSAVAFISWAHNVLKNGDIRPKWHLQEHLHAVLMLCSWEANQLPRCKRVLAEHVKDPKHAFV